ncbi:MAG: tetratricopeptide repeat protein [Phycisphaerales bacterium]
MSDWLDAEGHADRALEMFERGRWAEAESELRKAISLNPDQAEWHYNLGLTIEASGRDAEALACFARTAEMMPDAVEPLLAAGGAAQRLTNWADAIKWMDRALALEFRSEAAYAGKIEGLARLERHDEAETVFYLAQQALDAPSGLCLASVARSLIERESWERAAWCLREALRIDPSIPRLRAMLAFVLAARGHRQRAVQLYLRELREDPGNIDTLLDYGELLVDMGRFSEAAEKFRRVLELEPANVEAHERLGWIATEQGNLEQAHLEYELVLKLDPEFPGIRQSLAESMMARGLKGPARQSLREEFDAWMQETADATSAPPPDPDALDRFARLLLDAELPDEAARLLEAGGAATSDQPQVLRRLALARFRRGDIDGGCAAARRVLRHDPTCIASMHNLALSALNVGQLPVAAGWISRGLQTDRQDLGLRRLRMRLLIASAGGWLRTSIGRWRTRQTRGA